MGLSTGAVMAFGVGMSAIGGMGAADAQKATLSYEASVATNNAKIAGYQADQALAVGATQAQNQQLKTAQVKGDQRAAMAANGVDLGSGSASEILATTEYMGERDALTISDNAARQAWALRTQQTGYTDEAAVDRASSNAIDPTLAGITSLVTGSAKVASTWYNYKNATGTKIGVGAGPG